jgi:hypothetical protein
MNSFVVKDNMDFIDEDTSEKTGLNIKTPWDKEERTYYSFIMPVKSWLGRKIPGLSQCFRVCGIKLDAVLRFDR